MKIMLFVLDGLTSDKKLNKNLCDLYSLWIDMYIWCHQYKYTESDLLEFEASFLITNKLK